MTKYGIFTSFRKAAFIIAATLSAGIPTNAEASYIQVLEGGVEAIGLLGQAIDLAQKFGLNIGTPASEHYLKLTTSGDKYSTDLLLQGQGIFKTLGEHYTVNVFGDIKDAQGGHGTALFWTYDLQFNLTSINPLVFNDKLNITGNVRHAYNPDPGEAGGGPALDFAVTANADNAINNKLVVTDATKSGKHFGTTKHEDELRTLVNPLGENAVGARLTANTDTTFFTYDYFTSFTFRTGAQHIPEPSIPLLVGIGLVAAAIASRRRQNITL